MKQYEFYLTQYEQDNFFKPIRDKFDAIKLLMDIVKYVKLYEDIEEKSHCNCKLILRIDKSSRVFLISDGKYISMTFPFSVLHKDKSINFYSKNVDDIDIALASQIITFVQDKKIRENGDESDFFDLITSPDNDLGFWLLLKELIFSEDGYLRYDYDPEHVSGDVHPLYHYDIFYSSQCTFKIGINKNISHAEMIDLLDLTTACHFVKY
ncbi:MAG: hypothetical protein LBQ18_05855 [Campylobacteraceae bacterium]|jgi:hypothetical protein|nr:hypothetical protein [Campylobacteraceae bacterium]